MADADSSVGSQIDNFIYELPPEGGNPLLLFDIGAASSTPAWSPDGDSLAFESRSGNSRHIWIAERAGSDLQRLTNDGERNGRAGMGSDHQ